MVTGGRSTYINGSVKVNIRSSGRNGTAPPYHTRLGACVVVDDTAVRDACVHVCGQSHGLLNFRICWVYSECQQLTMTDARRTNVDMGLIEAILVGLL